MMLTSAFVSFVSCLDACLDAVGVRPPLEFLLTGENILFIFLQFQWAGGVRPEYLLPV
jgi:hypothetical protein